MQGVPAVRPQADPAFPPPPPPAQLHTHRSRPTGTQLTIEQMVRDAHARQASDIHIRVGEPPRLRIRGQIVCLSDHVDVSPQLFEKYLTEMLNDQQKKQFVERKELDTAIYYPGFLRCRVNCFETLTGGAVVLRLIPLDVPSIDGLGCLRCSSI